jgi:Zn finger protein HypA/HybF involved in hydrogenase expression
MPEIKAAEKIISDIISIGTFRGAQKVEVVRVGLGELLGADRAVLRSYLDEMSKGTIAEGAHIFLEERPGFIKCICGHEGAPEKLHVGKKLVIKCPRCRTSEVHNIRVTGGKDVVVEKVEVSR